MLAGTQVRLYRTPYPFRAAKLVPTTVTAADSTFVFSVSPDRDSRYSVQLAGTSARAQGSVGVAGRTTTKLTALSLGRAEVTILVHHPSDLRWAHAQVQWSYRISLGQLVHQIGRLEGHQRTFSIAVMTDGDPSMGYGIFTIQGVTDALL